MPTDSTNPALSAALGVLCDKRRTEIVVEDINSQRAQLRTALQRHFHGYGEILTACREGLDHESPSRFKGLLSRISTELLPHRGDITGFILQHTAEPSSIPGLTLFEEAQKHLHAFFTDGQQSGLQSATDAIVTARDQLSNLIDSLGPLDDAEGPEGLGMGSRLPSPPGGLSWSQIERPES